MPKKKFKKQKGQVLVIFLLIIVMALAIVLSVASRTITDIRTTSTTDESNRAYFAAEAGIEEGLQRAKNTPGITGGFTSAIENTTALTTNSQYGRVPFNWFIYPKGVERDSVAQVNLLSVLDKPLLGGWAGNTISVFWDTDQAVEVSLVYYENPNYGIRKYSFDAIGGRGNNFCTATPDTSASRSDQVTGLTKKFSFFATIYVFGTDAVPGCTAIHDLPLKASQTPVMLRVRPLYSSSKSSTSIGIDAEPASLPAQGSVIVSTANTLSGVTRKIQAVQLYSALPSLFDYVLFTNGDLSK